MKFSTDELITWFFAAAVPAGMFPEGAEAHYREALAKLKGPDRKGISSGVRQGVNDLLHMAESWSLEKSERVDTALAARRLPSVDEMQAILHQKHTRILKRGRIVTDEEFYIVKELVSDLTSELSKAQRRRLDAMLHRYEQSSGAA